MSLKIIPFEPRFSNRFRDLNIAWVEKYFHIETKDAELLENSQKNIIEKGGFIFFAEYHGEIVGCFSFIKLEGGIYELGKMAVDPKFQGLKIGQQLLVFAIDHARVNRWERIVLYSSTKLNTALHIYKKYGFIEVEIEDNQPYTRSDIKMELFLN